METTFSQDIQVASVRFQHEADQVRFESYPRRLIYKGREYVLNET